MPGIDELLRAEGAQWRTEVDAHHASSAAAEEPRSRRQVSRRTWTLSIAGLAAAAVVALAVGLGSGSGSSGNHTSSAAGSAAGREFSGTAAPAAGAGAASSAAVGLNPTSPLAPASAPGAPPVTSSALILTGSMSLTVATNADVDRAATRATGIADAAGGRVDADSRSTDGSHTATLVLRVPNSALPGVTTRLAALGKVSAQNLQTKDVTSELADVDSRVTSARAAIAALNRLYAQAAKVSDLIAVESALASRQADLEALEAQQRTLSAQTSLATLTLSIDVRAAAVTHHPGRHDGFVSGLRGGWHAFTATVKAVATAAGALLPFAALALVVGAAGVLVVRRRRA